MPALPERDSVHYYIKLEPPSYPENLKSDADKMKYARTMYQKLSPESKQKYDKIYNEVISYYIYQSLKIYA